MFEEILPVIRDFLQEYFNVNLGIDILTNIFSSILIIFVIWLLRWLALRLVHRQFRKDTRLLYNWRKVVEYVTAGLGIILVGRIWLSGIDTLVTYLGLVSAGLAIALQDLIVSMAGWIFIVWRRPFVVGDRIEVGAIIGDVIDVRVFSYSLLEVGGRIDAEQSTGRIIHIPNSTIFKEPLTNTHQGYPFIWNELAVMVTFESDWEKAKSILMNIIKEHAPDVQKQVRDYEKRAGRFIISYSNIAPTIYTHVADSGVVLTIRYLIDPRRIRGSENDIWEAILRAFGPHWDIDFAYPTTREYLHFEERKKRPDPQDAPTIVSSKAAAKRFGSTDRLKPPAQDKPS